MKSLNKFILIVLALVISIGAGYYLSQENVISQEESASKKSYPEPFPLHRAEFSTFLDAIETAGLGHIFLGTGPFTGFIPANEAFDKLDKKKWEDLQKPENRDQLTTILTYHMIPGKYTIDNLNRLAPTRLKTLNGQYLDITIENKEMKVNNVKIIQADLEGPNWMVHKIDSVLTPK